MIHSIYEIGTFCKLYDMYLLGHWLALAAPKPISLLLGSFEVNAESFLDELQNGYIKRNFNFVMLQFYFFIGEFINHASNIN